MPKTPDDEVDDKEVEVDDPDELDDDDLDDEYDEDQDEDEEGRPRRGMTPARRATLIAIPAALIAGLLVFWIVGNRLSTQDSAQPKPVDGVSITEVEGTTEICANLVDGLPATIGESKQRPVSDHPESLAWGDPPVVLVCGVPQPAGLDAAPLLNVVNGVTWKIDENVDTSAYGVPGTNTLWTAIDREVYIAVAVPNDVEGSVAMSPISTAVADRLPSVEN
ncbi:DUF3515 family protein [Epidermidibacterium keratini]|uniref:DUF3515 family protein n=1 Tax=Epidermidibacterium keratini TaxID=1891644 RepID=A0A7L4YRW3_9ACTN|nr:DUF3515 domain-containing protein [Epidermidibacterium keratini]QHC01802.1 DUF3515 family protein [Epidermidibacterium keratini]